MKKNTCYVKSYCTALLSLPLFLYSAVSAGSNGDLELSQRLREYKNEVKQLPNSQKRLAPKDYKNMTYPNPPQKRDPINSYIMGNLEKSLSRSKEFYIEINDFYNNWKKDRSAATEQSMKEHPLFSDLEISQPDHVHCIDAQCVVYGRTLEKPSKKKLSSHLETYYKNIKIKNLRLRGASYRLPANFVPGEKFERPKPDSWRYLVYFELI